MSIVRPSFQHWGPNSGLLCKKQIYQLKTKNTPCEVEFLIDKNFPKSGPNVLYDTYNSNNPDRTRYTACDNKGYIYSYANPIRTQVLIDVFCYGKAVDPEDFSPLLVVGRGKDCVTARENLFDLVRNNTNREIETFSFDELNERANRGVEVKVMFDPSFYDNDVVFGDDVVTDDLLNDHWSTIVDLFPGYSAHVVNEFPYEKTEIHASINKHRGGRASKSVFMPLNDDTYFFKPYEMNITDGSMKVSLDSHNKSCTNVKVIFKDHTGKDNTLFLWIDGNPLIDGPCYYDVVNRIHDEVKEYTRQLVVLESQEVARKLKSDHFYLTLRECEKTLVSFTDAVEILINNKVNPKWMRGVNCSYRRNRNTRFRVSKKTVLDNFKIRRVLLNKMFEKGLIDYNVEQRLESRMSKVKIVNYNA